MDKKLYETVTRPMEICLKISTADIILRPELSAEDLICLLDLLRGARSLFNREECHVFLGYTGRPATKED